MAHAREIAALRIVCLLASDWVTRRRTPRTTGRSRCALVGRQRAWPPLPELTGSYLHCGGRGGSSRVLGCDVGMRALTGSWKAPSIHSRPALGCHWVAQERDVPPCSPRAICSISARVSSRPG